SQQIMRDNKSRLRALIKELPDEQKQVLIMRHYLQMSFQEIAGRTGVSINTALGRMRYALINLRKKMIETRAYDKDVYRTRLDQVFILRNIGEREYELNNAHLCDSELLAMYNEISAVKKMMDEAVLEPSSQTILNILSHARGVSAKD